MNDTDDAFLFYAISKLPLSKRPKCISVRNASESQMVHAPFPHTTTPSEVINILKDMAGTVYGVYQYCTTLSSAFGAQMPVRFKSATKKIIRAHVEDDVEENPANEIQGLDVRI
jgi:hypothetical protein